jgi:hypothetical protein
MASRKSLELLEANSDLVKSREMFRLMAESTRAIPFTLDLARACFPYIGAQGIADTLVIAHNEYKAIPAYQKRRAKTYSTPSSQPRRSAEEPAKGLRVHGAW